MEVPDSNMEKVSTKPPSHQEKDQHLDGLSEKALSLVPSDELLHSLGRMENTRKVVREGLLLAGGAAAILLQVAMPGVAKGVDNHSNFAYRPLHRLQTTLTYIYCMAFGTRQEKKVIIETVNRAHAPVKGVDYSADDPHLQMWVAATLYATGIYLYEEVFGEMESYKADLIYQEYSVLALSLRVSRDVWPKDRNAFWLYWDEQVSKLEITDHARHVAKDLLYNKQLPLIFRSGLPIVRLMTAEMLPARVREGYGMRSTGPKKTVYKTIMLGAKIGYPIIPKFIRCYPLKYYMKGMRRRMNDVA